MRPKVLFAIMASIALVGAAWAAHWWRQWEPNPEHRIAYAGYQAIDLRFSPDGQKLAVVTWEGPLPEGVSYQATRVVRVSDGRAVRSIENGAWKCAWNHDGSLLAVGSADAHSYDVWETATWKLKRHLTLVPEVTKPKSSDAEVQATVVERLCFNQQGNLFAAGMFDETEVNVALKQVKVWWNPLEGPIVAESIGSCQNPWDVSSTSAAGEAHVAISFNSLCGVELLLVGQKGGKADVRRKIDLKKLPHALKVPKLRLTPDGKFLAIRDDERFDYVDVSGETPRLVYTLPDPSMIVQGRMLWWKNLDVSDDGRFAAYSYQQRLKVIRLADGKSMLDIAHEPCAFALAPDGSSLAVAESRAKLILFYQLPKAADAKVSLERPANSATLAVSH